MNLKNRSLTEPEARAAYLAMGPDRSLSALAAQLRERFGGKCVSGRTFEAWSAKNKWAALAAAHDARVTERAIAQIETAQVRTVAELASKSIDAADRGLDAAMKLEPQSFGDAINAAVAAGKFAQLLVGGATERVEPAVRRLSIDVKAGLAEVRAAGMVDAEPAPKNSVKH